MRHAAVSFALPYLNLALTSGDDLIGTCGNILYTIELEGRTKELFPDIAISMAADDVLDSATVNVETTV